MSDPVTYPDPRRVLAADRSSGRNFILRNLLAYCFRRTGDRARAEDAAQEAIVLVLAGKGWHRWAHDGKKSPEQSLLDLLCDVSKDVLKKHWQSAAHKREVASTPEDEARAVDPQGRPDERIQDLAAHEADMRRARLVLGRLDDRARAMLALEQEGVHAGADLAARLGCTVREVYRMREQVAYHRDRVLDEERATEGEP